ncbi:cytochrome P450 [Nonomuraea sp. NPDC050547]|uniref:cytochrome P450 n=1 Tax=Nonomuraea sp. NPDC050547 TaxID=3364368 RepID=UPI00378AE7F5
MINDAYTLPALPANRTSGCPFDPPRELSRAREHGPISRLPFPGGHEGWVVTGHQLARTVLGDPRFSSRQELMRSPIADLGDSPVPPAPPGMFIMMDPPRHSRYRKLLAGKFTVRRMRLLTERVERVTAERLDAMAAAGPPADLVSAFAQPIPAIMICELLGVPASDRPFFQGHVATMFDEDAPDEERYASHTAVHGYIATLVSAKRAAPTDDVLSDLTGTDLSEAELIGAAGLLLAAGMDTTSNMLSLGTFALLSNPGQVAVLREDPDRSVEELLRYLSVVHVRPRVALEDVELAGHTVKAGDQVILSLSTANRDPGRFEHPGALDAGRSASGHLAFGHGVHQCLGQQLARVELRTAFPALFERFPSLRLAVPAEEIAVRPETGDVVGVKSLPVTWDA